MPPRLEGYIRKRPRSARDLRLEKPLTDVELRNVNERLLISALREQELATTLEMERARLDAILSSIGDAVLVVNRDSKPVLTNAAYIQMIGSPDADIVLEDPSGQIVAPDEAPWRRAARGDAFIMEFSTLAPDGTRWWWEAHGRPIGDDAGAQGGVVIIRDVSERKRLEKALHHQALHDALTGLPNRALLHDRLDVALRSAQRSRDPLALLLLDLDHFKEINDTLGHYAGDLLLREVAARLLLTLRASDTVARLGSDAFSDMVARLGGDEFAMLLPGADRHGALEVAGRVRERLGAAIMLEGQIVHIRASIGIALALGLDTDAQTLLRQADIAMYEAKRTRNGHAFYTTGSG